MGKRRRPQTTSTHHRYYLRRRHGGDLISELNDDVLAHVLGLLPNATDVARACAVSRRWRCLRARVPSLRFSLSHLINPSGDVKQQEDVERFVAFVNRVLATRRAGVEQLTISIELHEGCCARAVPAVHGAHANAWIRYAMEQHGVRSFALKLDQPNLLPLPEQRRSYDFDEDADVHGPLTYLTLPLPATVAFDSLVDLSLNEIRLDDVHLLGRLLSWACCPRLQKLALEEIVGLKELRLDAGELLELSLIWDGVGLTLVELNTPKLRVLGIECYFIHHTTLTMSAPGLEELKSTFNWETLERLDVGDIMYLSSDGLKNLYLSSDGLRIGFGDVSGRLLRRCPAVESLDVHLACKVSHADEEGEEEEEGVIDDVMMRNDIPHLPLVTSLREQTKPTDPAGNQADYLSVSLPHLVEIGINGFQGTKCEARLMEWLHRSAPVVNKICFFET
uniref:F-box domain-containing protein n=1 Tax=Oryza glumipatula TaxID=40148 RepID=A0A0E0AT45_9ORYZ